MVEWLLCLLALGSATILQNSALPVDPIEVGLLNQDEITEYQFNMYTPVALDKSSYMYIVFPEEFETVTTSAVKYVENPGVISVEYTTATYSLSSRTLTITLPKAIPAMTTFAIKLEGVKNPASLTSTGYFKLYTRNVNDISNTTENWAFGTLYFSARFAGNVPNSATIEST
jgi:hypothetical protein